MRLKTLKLCQCVNFAFSTILLVVSAILGLDAFIIGGAIVVVIAIPLQYYWEGKIMDEQMSADVGWQRCKDFSFINGKIKNK